MNKELPATHPKVGTTAEVLNTNTGEKIWFGTVVSVYSNHLWFRFTKADGKLYDYKFRYDPVDLEWYSEIKNYLVLAPSNDDI